MVDNFPYQVKTFVSQQTFDRVDELCDVLRVNRVLIYRVILLPSEEEIAVDDWITPHMRIYPSRSHGARFFRKPGDGMCVVNVDLSAAQYELVTRACVQQDMSRREFFGERLDALCSIPNDQLDGIARATTANIERQARDLLDRISHA